MNRCHIVKVEQISFLVNFNDWVYFFIDGFFHPNLWRIIAFFMFCFDFLIAGYMHIYLCNVCVCLSVCQGTSNQLNLLGSTENHYNSMVRMFSNCSVVLENLEVTYTQKHHSLAFLQVCNLTQLIKISACPHCDKSLLGLDLWKIKGQSGHSLEILFERVCYFVSHFPNRRTNMGSRITSSLGGGNKSP